MKKQVVLGMHKLIAKNDEISSDSEESERVSQEIPQIHQTDSSAFQLPPDSLEKISNYYYKPVNRSSKKKTNSEDIINFSLSELPQSLTIRNRNRNLESNEEIEDLRDDENCLICLKNECNAVIMNCGHSGICFKCAQILLDDKGICHICRGKIFQVLKIKLTSKKTFRVIGLLNS